jgi:hypothetical protein
MRDVILHSTGFFPPQFVEGIQLITDLRYIIKRGHIYVGENLLRESSFIIVFKQCLAFRTTLSSFLRRGY